MRKLNDREKAIAEGYQACLEGRQIALALRDNGKWTPTKSPRRCYKICFKTPDGLLYSGYPAEIEEKFMN